MSISRRNFIKLSAAASAAGFAGVPMIGRAASKRVVVVGGGVGAIVTVALWVDSVPLFRSRFVRASLSKSRPLLTHLPPS